MSAPVVELPHLAYSREQAARACGVGVSTIQRAIGTGALRAKRSGPDATGRVLITTDALKAWLEGLDDA